MDMRDQKFGIEIEMTGITRKMAASVIAAYFSKQAQHVGGAYDEYMVNLSVGWRDRGGYAGRQQLSDR